MILWSAGSNAQGQLATRNQEDSHEFKQAFFDIDGMTQTTAPGRVLQIACGANHTLALLRNSSDSSLSLWGAGDGSKGQLGIGTDVSQGTQCFKPLVLTREMAPSSADEIRIIQASWETSFVVLRSHTRDRILSFGSNDFGLLGTGDNTLTPSAPTVNEVRLDHLVPHSAAFLRVAYLKAGPRHVLAILRYANDGTERDMLVGWGAGRHGQLELRSPDTFVDNDKKPNGPQRVPLPLRIMVWMPPVSVVDMSVGYQHALLLLSDGSMAKLGSDAKSQMPSGSDLPQERYSRIRCSWNNSYAAFGDSESLLLIRSYGRNAHGQLGRAEGGSEVNFPSSLKIRDIVCGSEHCLVMATDGDS